MQRVRICQYYSFLRWEMPYTNEGMTIAPCRSFNISQPSIVREIA